MITRHCSDDELQLLAGGGELPDKAMRQHIESCAACQEQIAVYKTVISGIEQQPAAAFDFDLAEAVLEQIRPARKKIPVRALRPAIIVVFTAVCLYLFRNNFVHLVNGSSGAFLLVSIIACIGIIVFKVLQIYRSYERQIEKLDLSE